MKITKIFLLILALALSNPYGLSAQTPYEKISPQEAKAIMGSGQKYILLDTRTPEEYGEGHLEGAILIPHNEIKQKIEKEVPDKNALILVYCRTGRRSKIASEELARLGYTQVKDFGGLNTWEK